ncbi:MAG TPA: hypothetical protein VE979_09850 [Streptosporangiaceae bacterium]|jgi:hypothetical protein|nr:hypothetical protein [Streptosporangiaceae bacterium]
MLTLLLIDVALFVVLIMVAALVVTRRRRRSNGRPPAPADARGAGQAIDPHEIAIVPGFSDTVPPDRDVDVPVQPERARHPQARPADGPGPDPHSLGPPSNGRRATARALTTNEEIAGYYDRADKAMADYLTARGWNNQPLPGPESPGPAEGAGGHPPPGNGHRR